MGKTFKANSLLLGELYYQNLAGTVERAPLAWQRWGFEWLWRIRQEPALFKRYWADGRALFGLVLRALRFRLASRR